MPASRNSVVLADKSIKQSNKPFAKILSTMQRSKQPPDEAIRIGVETDAPLLKRLSLLAHKELRKHQVRICYNLCTISKVAGALASRKKSIRRRFLIKDPHLKKSLLVSYQSARYDRKVALRKSWSMSRMR